MRTIIAAIFLLASLASASAQDWKVWVDFTAQGKRTTGYWLVQGTSTPEVFVNQQHCEVRAQAILTLLQSLRAEIKSVRCTR